LIKEVGDSGVHDEYRCIVELKGRWRSFCTGEKSRFMHVLVKYMNLIRKQSGGDWDLFIGYPPPYFFLSKKGKGALGWLSQLNV